MSKVINLLPDSVANQIAAGEVVQRPASVVKELMENAVDAGALSIIVSIKEGGKELIQVIDDGSGMSPEDAQLAFERHATSKITKAVDLYALSTFGFRGEALASIASVAEVELKTKRDEDELGTRIIMSGGDLHEQVPVNITRGSQFSIKNLFYNIPARRKFLKSNSTETKFIVDEIQRVALCNPQIDIKFYNNDTLQYNLPKSGTRQRIVGIIGKSINSHLLDISVDTSIISIKGFIGTPDGASKSSKQFLFVNDRYFRSAYFNKAVIQAYDKLIQGDVQPSYFLYMNVDPQRIDVNIHPSKTEIKFEDEQAIWQILNAAVRESLGKIIAVPTIDFDNDSPIDIPVLKSGWSYKEPESSLNPDFNPFTENVSQKGSRGNILKNMSYEATESVPEGWEVLYKNSYDSDDRVKHDGDTFRDFISSENDNESDFVSKGFVDSDDSFSEIESEYESMSDIQSKIEFFDDEDTVRQDFLKISPKMVAITYKGQLLIVDMVRAYRRVIYEKTVSKTEIDSSVNQQRMFPEEIELSSAEFFKLTELRVDLLKMGVDLREVGENIVALYGVPSDMERMSPKQIIEILLEIDESGDTDINNRKQRIAQSIAMGISLSHRAAFVSQEIENILSLLFALPDPIYSPEGKPIMTVVTQEEILQRLK